MVEQYGSVTYAMYLAAAVIALAVAAVLLLIALSRYGERLSPVAIEPPHKVRAL